MFPLLSPVVGNWNIDVRISINRIKFTPHLFENRSAGSKVQRENIHRWHGDLVSLLFVPCRCNSRIITATRAIDDVTEKEDYVRAYKCGILGRGKRIPL